MISPAGAVNGLAQTVLKMTVPGMPDFFQGTEFWDFSLVDPDNRRPVDYDARRTAMAANAEPTACQQSWRDGRVKQAVIRDVLGLRRQAPNLFARGGYVPLPVKGLLEERVIAFSRDFGAATMIVVVPRLVQGALQAGDSISFDPSHLRATSLSIPKQIQRRQMRSLLAHNSIAMTEAELPIEALLADFPVALLYAIESA